MLDQIINLLKKKIIFKSVFPEGIVVWEKHSDKFYRVREDKEVDIDLLCNINRQKEILIKNTILFSKGKPSNNALLWGARGTGKSTLVLAIYKKVSKHNDICLIEVKRNQIKYLSYILRKLEKFNKKFIIFCDDFSFSTNTKDFVLFKNILDGSVSRNNNFIYYVTSNYRNIIRNTNVLDEASMLNKQEIIDDETALSDRFGIWLGFEKFEELEFLKIVDKYCGRYKIAMQKSEIRKRAIKWSLLRGSKSGREALNFAKSLLNNKL